MSDPATDEYAQYLDDNAEEIVARIYWYRNQLPPKDWREQWPAIREQILEKHTP
jgi:hypothetical protein